ncbi:MAG: SAM-dependent methyltransferase, partial [Acidobacteriota bacterium]
SSLPSEELDALEAAGLEVEVVPGLTSAFTAPLTARIPVTERGRARDVAVLTVQTRRGLDLEPLRRVAGADTLVLLMGGAQLPAIRAVLCRCGRSPATPAAVIERATQDRQRVLRTTLGELPEDVGSAGLRAPMTVVIGEVAAATNRAVPGPLAGRRVVLTQPPGRRIGWARRLRNLGAEVLEMPLSIVRPRTAVDGRGLRTLENLQRFDVAVFTSADAVDGFRHLLAARGYDARVFGGVRLAATAEAAEALGRWGLRADRVAPGAGGLDLDSDAPTGRILWPRGESCPAPGSADGPGWRSMVVYDRVAIGHGAGEHGTGEHGAVERERLEDGVDLVYLDDPTSAEAFRRRGLKAPGARFAAGDAATAEAARAVGLGPVQTLPGGDLRDLRDLRSLLEVLPGRASIAQSAPWTEALDALAV